MRVLHKIVAGPLVILLALSSSAAFADERHVVDPAAIAATMDARVARQDADRAAIREALARAEVREMAGRVGIDLSRIDAAVATLDGQDLERAAEAARQVNHSFVGGASTVVISTTTIIIALLVVILLIVALK
jgi:hypothetical protein